MLKETVYIKKLDPESRTEGRLRSIGFILLLAEAPGHTWSRAKRCSRYNVFVFERGQVHLSALLNGSLCTLLCTAVLRVMAIESIIYGESLSYTR